MAKIPESEIERLKTEISLERVVEGAGVKLKKRGADRIGHCPFHDDKTPSFIVSPAKNLWNCLGACGEGGDVISFVMKIEGVSFRHGVELLRDGYAPHEIKPVKKASTPKLDTFEREKDDQAMLERVCNYYHASLPTIHADLIKYLIATARGSPRTSPLVCAPAALMAETTPMTPPVKLQIGSFPQAACIPVGSVAFNGSLPTTSPPFAVLS